MILISHFSEVFIHLFHSWNSRHQLWIDAWHWPWLIYCYVVTVNIHKRVKAVPNNCINTCYAVTRDVGVVCFHGWDLSVFTPVELLLVDTKSEQAWNSELCERFRASLKVERLLRLKAFYWSINYDDDLSLVEKYIYAYIWLQLQDSGFDSLGHLHFKSYLT